MSVVPMTPLIRTTVMPISGVIGKTVVRIACIIGIGYQHDMSLEFSNKHFTVNFQFNIVFIIEVETHFRISSN